MWQSALSNLVVITSFLSMCCHAFAPRHFATIPSRFTDKLLTPQAQERQPVNPTSLVCLQATGDGKKKKRRRRKNQPPGSGVDQVKTEQSKTEKIDNTDDSVDDIESVSDDDIYQIQEVANFQFEKDTDSSAGFQDGNSGMIEGGGSNEVIPLPDIKQARQKKEAEEFLRLEEERLKEKRKIKRSDKEAFARLLEQQPYADADDSFFEKEKYTAVSALLSEGSAPFLGIPSGPLQVGHFIGALGILLMAFIDYPGFPLTNLPTPLRDCLQGGLAVTYAINLVLAVLAVFKAGERGQPAFLWVLKTLSVGGLAFDQLTQLPTLEQLEKKPSGRRP